MSDMSENATHFGERTVFPEQKQELVNDVFHTVADRYDLMNDLMSGGIHRLWKNALVAEIAPPKGGTRPFEVLDMAGGTGDIAARILDASHGYAKIVVADINVEMLRVGTARAANWRYRDNVDFVEANAENLPFEENRFDIYVISFGLRNVPRIERALQQARRVLKRGGQLKILEFSQMDIPLVDKAYDLYSNHIIPRMGEIVTGEKHPYQYLVQSIRKFPKPQQLCRMIENAGFSRVSCKALTGNIAALHSGWKIR